MACLPILPLLLLLALLPVACGESSPDGPAPAADVDPAAPETDGLLDEPLPPWDANDRARDRPSLALLPNADVWMACQVFDGQGETLELSLLTEPDSTRRTVGGRSRHLMGSALAADAEGGLLAVWSAFDDGAWSLREVRFGPAPAPGELGPAGPVETLLAGPGRRPIHPVLVAGADGRLLLAWMELGADGPAVWARLRGPDGWGPEARVGPGGWMPALAARDDGSFALVYDAMVADSYDVLLADLEADAAGALTVRRRQRLTDSPLFEAHPSVACQGGRTYVAYEEGPADWGREGSTKQLGVALHTTRKVRILCLEGDRLSPLRDDFMAALKPVLRNSCEKPKLRVDGNGNLVLAFRGMPLPREFQDPRSRAFQEFADQRGGAGVGWRTSIWFTFFSVYDGTSWSYKGRHHAAEEGSEGRSDAPFALAPLLQGGTAFAMVGDQRERDLAGDTDEGDHVFSDQVYWWRPISTEATDISVGRLGKGDRAMTLPLGEARPLPPWVEPAPREPHLRVERRLADGTVLRSALGDLHRHTDLSRCSSNWDGPFLDQVRYAVDVGGLDYLGVTDHFEHMTWSDWWRSLGAMEAYHAPGRMVQLYGYERSDVITGHRNVISAERPPPLVGYRRKYHEDRDVARADSPAELWQHFAGHEVLTIPHTPAGMYARFPAVFDWLSFNPRYDRLLEVWQGYRGGSESEDGPRALQTGRPSRYARAVLDGGVHFGVIASSDHQSTFGSFAGTWTTGLTRREVFDGLHGRLTWASTCPMVLWAEWDGVPMGVSAQHEPGITDGVLLEVTADRELALAELVLDGSIIATRALSGRQASVRFTLADLSVPEQGSSYVYLRVRTADDELGWTSPTRLSGDGSPGPDGPDGEDAFGPELGKQLELGWEYTATWVGGDR